MNYTILNTYQHPSYPGFIFTTGEKHFDEDHSEYYEATAVHPDGRTFDCEVYLKYFRGWVIDLIVNESEITFL